MTASILIVGGENTVAMDLQATLTRLGYAVAGVASTGEEALILAAETRPDCVLMDIMLRGELDGIGAAAIIRERWDIPVLFRIANTDDKSLARATAAEPFGFIVEPFHDRELRSSIELALYKHRAERELRAREKWYATTLRSIADGVISADVKQRVTFMNGAAERLTAWSAADAVGRRFGEVFSVVHEESRAPVDDPVARALAERQAVTLPEHSALLRRDGGQLPIDDSAAPILDDDGAVLGAVVVFRDVSEKRRLQARLLVADRMASVGMLAAGIGHEINNPLSYVVANIDYALQELEGPPKDALASLPRLGDALREAREGAERVGKIVRQLRSWSRPQTEQPRILELHSVLDDACAMITSEIRPRARLVREYGAPPAVLADEAHLVQLFIILLVNAAQAIPEGHADEHEIRVATRHDPSGAAVVEIHDTGQGSDLGSPILRNVVGSLGGRVEIESIAGEGSTFRVILPRALAAGSGQVPAIGDADAAVAPAARRVLIVDDEPLICGAVQRALSPEYDVTAFTSAREALENIAAGNAYDAILVDLLMPEMSGMDLYAELFRIAPAAARRVVFLTGGAFTKRASDFLAGVGNRHLVKPFDTRTLQAVLTEVVTKPA